MKLDLARARETRKMLVNDEIMKKARVSNPGFFYACKSNESLFLHLCILKKDIIKIPGSKVFVEGDLTFKYRNISNF